MEVLFSFIKVDTAVKLTLRVLPVQTNGAQYTKVESDSIIFHGSSHIVLPVINPKDTFVHKFPFICLSHGLFGFRYEVKERIQIDGLDDKLNSPEIFLDQSIDKILYITAQW